jgi:DNA ligase-1
MLNTLIKPMLLQKSTNPPTGNYIHQLKFDGFRCLLHFDTGNVRLFTRHQNECTRQFPEIKPNLPIKNCIFDGEMVVMDGIKPCFESIMQRFNTSNDISIKYLTSSMPAHFVAFDILYLEGKNLTKLPLYDRLEFLKKVIGEPSDAVSICPSSLDGQALFHSVKNLELEGICSKKLDSPYLFNTRNSNWLKVKNYLYETVTITGIRKKEFGWSLSLDGEYVGVMEFVPPNERKVFYSISKQIVYNENEKWKYLQPIFKCKVKFQSYTKSGLMRSPSFVEFVFN